jgi:putative Mg2+ transporter-C (MgtC) family protein
MFALSCAVTVLGLVALTLLRRFEDKRDDVVRRRITVTITRGATPIERVEEELRAFCLEVSDTEYETRLATENRVVVTFEVQVTANVSVAAILASLEALPGVEQIRVHLV